MSSQKDSSTAGYQVLARRYRSRSFTELIGQEAIAETLCNAIERGRTAHAYLFTGTRGVGKTSMARIFAAALNATDDLTQKDEVADAIFRGEDIDVIEIDAASNNGVADARDLIANSGLMPARSPWKIYIIDEVHMLSTAAFNALLKTMEEPPPHVKFILCTTEAHKVIPTIQSRCQRFDFRPIPVSRITAHLEEVIKSESITSDDGVINRIAQLANGSMRDGLSLLERLIAATDDRLDAEVLERALGLVPEELLSRVVDAIADSSPADTIRAGAALLDGGFAISQALDALAERFRDLLAAGVCGPDVEVLGMDEEQARTICERASAFQPEDLVHLISLCDAVAARARFSGAGRAVFDAGLVRMALQERFANAAALLEGGGVPSSKKKRPAPDSRKLADPAASPPVPAPKPTPPTPPAPAKTTKKTTASAPPRTNRQVEPKDSTPAPPQRPPVHPDGPWAALEASAGARDRAALASLQFERLEGQQLVLRLRNGSGSAGAWVRDHPESLAPLVLRALGPGISLQILDSPVVQREARPGLDMGIRNNPVVKEAMDLFDASVVETRSAPEKTPEDTVSQPASAGKES